MSDTTQLSGCECRTQCQYLFLLHGFAVGVNFEAECFCGEILVSRVDEADGPAALLEDGGGGVAVGVAAVTVGVPVTHRHRGN